MTALTDLWLNLSATNQDLLLLAVCLLPGFLLLLLVCRGYRPGKLVSSLLKRYRWSNSVFVLLIATAVGLGIAVLAQERALREGSANAADRFDVVIGPPGSDVELMLSVVHLQQPGLTLLSPELFKAVSEDAQVALAAPLAFGDSVSGHPLVGTTGALLDHLGAMAEGRVFADHADAVIGSAVSFSLGDRVSPAHGHGTLADEQAHSQHQLTIVGRLAPTGTVWDTAVIAPVEMIWETHGLGTGHEDESLGPPFDVMRMPGVNAIVVRADSLAANYALRSRYTNGESLAIFPGEVLFRLHGVLGNVRILLSSMALLTQALVVISVGASLVILLRLFSRRFAMLRALGAPPRFLLAVVVQYSACVVIIGAILGVLVGWALSTLASAVLSRRMQFEMQPDIVVADLHLVAAFMSLCLLLALVPGLLILRRSIVADLPA